MDRARILAASRTEAAHLAGQRLREVTPSRRDFAQFVTTQRQELAVIARLSAAGREWSTAQLVKHAQMCDETEVAALAVATGAGGLSMADLEAIATATTAPLLRDDLLLDPSQLYQARLHGADAAIFPAADLDPGALAELVNVASSLHMASVVEVLCSADVTAALRLPHALIGVRCLDGDARLDLTRTLQLARALPTNRTVICLPEVHSSEECAQLRGHCDAVMVGEVLNVTGDVAAALKELLAL